MLRNGSLYAKSARFDDAHPLTNDELREYAPSIFATEAHESRSNRFRPIPTIEVIEGLRKEGFFPVAARQCVTRDESKKAFTKHLVRLRRFDNVESYKVGGTVCEALLKNANDGSAAYDLMSALWRILCMNSMVAKTSSLADVKIRHSGDVTSKVIEGTYSVISESQKALVAPAEWSQIVLKREAALALAEGAHLLRFADSEGNVTTPIKPDQFLMPRRQEDRATDLWTTFNVVQENTIRGGLSAYGRNANNQMRRSTTRTINGIDQDVKLNKALWILGERMAQMLKSAA